jgi:NAD(P)-dependent dehydrogenase (short-subunit alcohol dehydrogenase family)
MAAGEKRAAPSTVINVGSSAHLRATHVLDDEWLASGESNNKQSWIDSIPDASDSDLTTYAKSKLALMQFSTIVRHCLPTCDSPIRIFDAHPGLVWTSLLRNHIGDRAVRMLTSTGLANIIYKSSSEGAHAIVSALDYAPSSSARVADEKEQMYFVNGMPDGFASPESASFHASLLLWKYVLKPELEGVVEMNDEWTSMKQMIEAMEKQIDM